MPLRAWTAPLLLALGLSTAEAQAQEAPPFEPARKNRSGFQAHEFVPLEFGYAALGDATRYRLNVLGIGAGHTLADLHSSMPLLSPVRFDEGPWHLPVLGLTSTVSALFVAWASNNVESQLLRTLAMPIVLFPFLLNTEIRLLPLFPASAYAGYSFDLIDGERFHILQAFRYGAMATYKYGRLKLGAEHTVYRGSTYFAYSASIAVVMSNLEGALGR